MSIDDRPLLKYPEPGDHECWYCDGSGLVYEELFGPFAPADRMERHCPICSTGKPFRWAA